MEKHSDFYKTERKKVEFREQRSPPFPPPPPAAAPGPVPHTYQGCGAASPQLSPRGDAGMARSGPRRGSRPGPPRAGGSHGTTSPGAERSPRAAKRAPCSGSVAPGRTLREGAGRGRLGGALAAPSPPGRRQNAPWIPAAGAGFAAPRTPPTPPRSGGTRHGPGDTERGGRALTAARKSRRRRAWLVPPGVI